MLEIEMYELTQLLVPLWRDAEGHRPTTTLVQ